ncbi:hypothetical protein [Flavobacterium algicola]|uniref:hypothetical protein n=1 Tax=Flavobacterium algicola TaxID=556529 RepID=UPI001EFE6595|nr:hypothetical protein [Flavobacterium algicola]MCG9791159.1 hypothetical protein [Flavobacterium algicola]
MEYTFEKYDLKLIDNEDNTCKTALLPNNGIALLKERRKLYIIHFENDFLYVGEAYTSIKTRFQRGCTSFNYFIRNKKTRGGYKGYKWLDKVNNLKRNLTVSVVVFNEEYDSKRHFIEAIEGELVYLIRQKSGYWPKFQNEIHFSNCDGAKEIAEDIRKKVFNNELV